MARFAKRIAIAAAFVVVAGAPLQGAWAGADGALSGTYEGKAVCSGLFNGAPNKQTHEITGDDSARITHGSTNAVLEIPDLGRFMLFVENNTQKPGQSKGRPSRASRSSAKAHVVGSSEATRRRPGGNDSTGKNTPDRAMTT